MGVWTSTATNQSWKKYNNQTKTKSDVISVQSILTRNIDLIEYWKNVFLETFSNSASGVVLPSSIILTMVAVRTINNTVKNVVVKSLDVSKSADERILTLSWKPVVSVLVNTLVSSMKGSRSWKRSKSWREVISLQMDHFVPNL